MKQDEENNQTNVTTKISSKLTIHTNLKKPISIGDFFRQFLFRNKNVDGSTKSPGKISELNFYASRSRNNLLYSCKVVYDAIKFYLRQCMHICKINFYRLNITEYLLRKDILFSIYEVTSL